MQSIRILSRPSFKKTRIELVEPILKNIYQSNNYRKDLCWPHFNEEARIQEKQQEKDQHSQIFVFVSFLTIPSSN